MGEGFAFCVLRFASLVLEYWSVGYLNGLRHAERKSSLSKGSPNSRLLEFSTS